MLSPRLGLLTMWAAFSAAHSIVSAQAGRPAFGMSISVERSTVHPGAEVAVKVALINTSDQEIHIYRARSGPPLYRFSVTDQKGNPAPLTPLGQAILAGKMGYTNEKGETRILTGSGASSPVAPGAKLYDEFSISYYVDLTQPNRYTIRLMRVDPYTKLVVESNAIILTVAKQV
jgi:hypothetical protein